MTESSHKTDATTGGDDKRIVLTIGRPLKGCRNVRTLAAKGVVGIKTDPLHEPEMIQRVLNHVRGVHPPPVLVVEGQQFPAFVEGSPRSPRLMMEALLSHGYPIIK